MSSLQLLIENLSNVYNLQLDMKRLAEQKKDILINGKIDELSKIIQQESIWIKQIKDLEETRINIISELDKGNKITSADSTITDLINDNLISSPEKEQLKEIQDKMKNLLEEIKKENEINSQLIKQSLDFVSHSLKTIAQEPTQSLTYSKSTTNPKNFSNSGLFDKKV